jgi:predicted nucleic acid-binding protein
LLRLAYRDLYVMRISERILDELERNLVRKYDRMDSAKAAKYVDAIREAFEDAIVDEDAIRTLEPAMKNDPGDRHVLAAAVASGAEGIVSFNRKHFPQPVLQPLDKALIHPDEFLSDLIAMYEATVLEDFEEWSARLRNPPRSVEELIARLERNGVPRFAQRLRDGFGL